MGMVSGRPQPLESTFKLSYYTLLNTLKRADGVLDQEKVIARSFHQFQHDLQASGRKSNFLEACQAWDSQSRRLKLKKIAGPNSAFWMRRSSISTSEAPPPSRPSPPPARRSAWDDPKSFRIRSKPASLKPSRSATRWMPLPPCGKA